MLPLASLLVLAVAPVHRAELRVTPSDGVHVTLREVLLPTLCAGAEPIVLLHGARVPGIGSFDLPVAGGSLVADLALLTGARVYSPMPVANGRSDRPAAMSRPPGESPQLCRSVQIVRNVDAVVRRVLARTGARQVTLLGWATGAVGRSVRLALARARRTPSCC